MKPGSRDKKVEILLQAVGEAQSLARIPEPSDGFTGTVLRRVRRERAEAPSDSTAPERGLWQFSLGLAFVSSLFFLYSVNLTSDIFDGELKLLLADSVDLAVSGNVSF